MLLNLQINRKISFTITRADICVMRLVYQSELSDRLTGMDEQHPDITE